MPGDVNRLQHQGSLPGGVRCVCVRVWYASWSLCWQLGTLGGAARGAERRGEGPRHLWLERPLVFPEFSTLQTLPWSPVTPLPPAESSVGTLSSVSNTCTPSKARGSLRALGRPRLVLGTESSTLAEGLGEGGGWGRPSRPVA